MLSGMTGPISLGKHNQGRPNGTSMPQTLR